MTQLNADFHITDHVVGNRAFCVATVHGTTGKAMTDPDIHIPGFADRFNLAGTRKPIYVVKANHPDEGTSGWPAPSTTGIAGQFTEAQAAGYETMLQVTQLKDSGEDPAETAAAMGSRVDALIRAVGVSKIDWIALTNEGNIDAQFADPDALATFHADALAQLESDATVDTAYVVPRLCVGHFASYSAMSRWLPPWAKAMRDAGCTTAPELVAVHQYENNPKLALRVHQLHKVSEELIGLPTACLETDYSFSGTTTPVGFQDVPHAIYALVNNLEHAYHNVPCADFVFMNDSSHSAATVGNGIYRSDGSGNNQAVSFEDILADFISQPMVAVLEQSRRLATGVFCYANEAREIVLVNMPASVAKQVGEDFSMSLRGRAGGHFVESDILDYLRSEGPEPASTPPAARPDWPAFRNRAWAANQSNNEASVEVTFDEISKGFTLVKSMSWTEEPSWDWGSGALTATLPPFSALYLRGVM